MEFLHKRHDTFYVIFRVIVGLLFAQHGAQKLFGVLGGHEAPLLSLFGVAGVIEFFGGLLIAIGLVTRIAALVTLCEMFVAYLKMHVTHGLAPIVNQGELAVLYFVCFLVILSQGSVKWGLDNLIRKRKK